MHYDMFYRKKPCDDGKTTKFSQFIIISYVYREILLEHQFKTLYSEKFSLFHIA